MTHKSISSIWIVWSTLYVYLCHILSELFYKWMVYFCNLDSPKLTGSETRHDISDIEGLPRPPFLPVIYYKLNYSQSLRSHVAWVHGELMHIWWSTSVVSDKLPALQFYYQRPKRTSRLWRTSRHGTQLLASLFYCTVSSQRTKAHFFSGKGHQNNNNYY